MWICAEVGAGDAKAVPGAVRPAEAGICPAGVEPMWQFSQVVDDGMCALAPAGDVGGMPLMAGPWHEAQLLVIPAWLMSDPLNLAPSMTWLVGRLEPAPTWQVSQAVVMGMWLLGGAVTLKPLTGMAKLGATLAPWHWAHPPLVGALA